MIKYKDINAEVLNTELSEQEKTCLHNIQLHVDIEIKKQFPHSNCINLTYEDIHLKLVDIPAKRKDIVLEHLKNVASTAGWTLTYESDDRYSYYNLTPKK